MIGLPGFILAIASNPLIRYFVILAITIWLTLEIGFYVYLRYIVLPQLNRLTTPVPGVNTPWDQFHKIIDVVAQLKGRYDFNRFFSGWFLYADPKIIRRGNIREMLGWALYSKSFIACDTREKACVEQTLMWVKMRFQVDAAEGFNPDVKPMLLTLTDISYIHRPLAFYAMLTVIQVVGHAVLMLLGFKRHEINGIAYWYRSTTKPVPAEERSIPLIFFHGISPGLNLYLLVVHMLSRGRKAVLVEVPHIAMCLNFKAKRLGDMVKTVEIISKRHRMPQFAVCGHSFGSLCAAWVTKHLKGSVKQLILLDPVSMLLGLPDVCFNFLHKKPRTMMEYILHFGGSTEITIHHTLRRQFWWYEGQLFLDEIKCPCFIGLSGNDEIVPSSTLRLYIDDYINKHHVEEHHRHKDDLRFNKDASLDKSRERKSSQACEYAVDGPGCVKHRIQYSYWEGWSHGEILFRYPSLKALDRALREQERFFRLPEQLEASEKGRPKSSKLTGLSSGEKSKNQ